VYQLYRVFILRHCRSELAVISPASFNERSVSASYNERSVPLVSACESAVSSLKCRLNFHLTSPFVTACSEHNTTQHNTTKYNTTQHRRRDATRHDTTYRLLLVQTHLLRRHRIVQRRVTDCRTSQAVFDNVYIVSLYRGISFIYVSLCHSIIIIVSMYRCIFLSL